MSPESLRKGAHGTSSAAIGCRLCTHQGEVVMNRKITVKRETRSEALTLIARIIAGAASGTMRALVGWWLDR